MEDEMVGRPLFFIDGKFIGPHPGAIQKIGVFTEPYP
jgi:hypothetical protein